MSATQVLKLEDAEGSVLLVTRIDDVGYAFHLAGALNEDGEAMPFRLLDDDARKQLRDFLKSLA